MSSRVKLLFAFFTLWISFSNAQSTTPTFEGEIIYTNTYKSKNPKLREKQVATMMGTVHNYFIKGGDYKTVTNGLFAQWQLYVNKENRIYNKMASSDTVFWNDAAVHDDQLLMSTLNKNAVTILGYVCDELVMTFTSGVHKYYYNAKLRVDSKLYENHKYGNYYNYISKANAVPLKMIVEDSDIIMESTATKVVPKKLPADFFSLPAGTKIAASLY